MQEMDVGPVSRARMSLIQETNTLLYHSISRHIGRFQFTYSQAHTHTHRYTHTTKLGSFFITISVGFPEQLPDSCHGRGMMLTQ